MEKLFAVILPAIEHFHVFGYWIAFVAALAETVLVIGLFLPGSTLLLLLGALSANGHLNFADLLWFAIAGAILGDNVNYWLGRRYGNQWVRDDARFLTPEHFERTRRFFERYGAKSVFLGRFIPSVKEIVPFLAGAAGMRQRTFMLWNILGGIGWGLQWIGGGYLFGQSFKLAETWISRTGMLLVAILLTWLLLRFLRHFAIHQGRKAWQVMGSLSCSILDALARNSFIQQWMHRYPGSIHFLAKRVDRSQFTGLPLTLLGLAFTCVLALFASVAEDVVTLDSIVTIDHVTARWIAIFRAPGLIEPVAWISGLGAPPVVGVLLVVACLELWLINRRFAGVGLLVSTLGASLFSLLAKLVFERPRPVAAALVEPSFSFPSSHATAAVAFYGFLGYLLIRLTQNRGRQVKLFLATTGFVLLIGLSRIVLGVHYLSDIWAGYLAGAMWLIIGIGVNEWLSASGWIIWNMPGDRRRKAMATGLAIMTITGIIIYLPGRMPPLRNTPAIPVVEVERPLIEVLKTRMPVVTTSLPGTPEQPLSFALIVPDRNALVARLKQAGWMAADPPTLRNILHLLHEGLNYVTAPLVPVFWNDQINELAFGRVFVHKQEKILATVRIWATPLQLGKKRVFVGIAREYTGIRWLVHTAAPDVDIATGEFIDSLGVAGQPLTICSQVLVPPTSGVYLTGDHFFTKGKIQLIDLSAEADVIR